MAGEISFCFRGKKPTFNACLSETLANEAPPGQGRSFYARSRMKRDFYSDPNALGLYERKFILEC